MYQLILVDQLQSVLSPDSGVILELFISGSGGMRSVSSSAEAARERVHVKEVEGVERYGGKRVREGLRKISVRGSMANDVCMMRRKDEVCRW